MARAASEAVRTADEGDIARAVLALERLWTAVRNYGIEHAGAQDAAQAAVEVLRTGSGEGVMTLRVAPGRFVGARSVGPGVRSELAERLYAADVAALVIDPRVAPSELIHLVSEVGCPAVAEARSRTDALIAQANLPAITLLRMRFEGLSAEVAGSAASGAWDALAAQLLNPSPSGFDPQRVAGAIEELIEAADDDGRVLRDVLAQISAKARQEGGDVGTATVKRMQSAIAQLDEDVRARLAAVSGDLTSAEFERLPDFIEIMPLSDGLACLKSVSQGDGAPAVAGVRMVQRLARVAGPGASELEDLAAIAERWSVDAGARQDPHAQTMERAARLLRSTQDQSFNPEAYDALLASIAAAVREPAAPLASDAELVSQDDYLSLGLELLESPDGWREDRATVMQELDRVIEDATPPDQFFRFVDRLTQARTTAGGQASRREAATLLERVLASPRALAVFSRAGASSDGARVLAVVTRAGVPAAVDLLARLAQGLLHEDTQSLVNECLRTVDPGVLRERVAHALKHDAELLLVLVPQFHRLREKDVHPAIQACLAHHAEQVRAAALRSAVSCMGPIPIEWIHAGLRDEAVDVRRSAVRVLTDMQTPLSTELLTLHVLGDLRREAALTTAEMREAIDAVAGAEALLAERCLSAIIGRSFGRFAFVRSGAPAYAAIKLRTRTASWKGRITLLVWSIWPARVLTRLPCAASKGAGHE